MGWWNNIWTSRAQDWIFGYLEPSQVPDRLARKPVQPNTAYISVFLRSMRIVNVRKGLTKFYGTVHSLISLPHISGSSAQFHVLTTPSSLSDIDAANIDRVVSMNTRLLGPIPYRGGDLEVEVGLFSIQSADLAKPFLSVLEGMSQAAGVSYISAALPFVGPILQGVNLLAGGSGGTILEVGLAKPFSTVDTGTMAVIRAPKGSINLAQLKADQDYRLLDADGQSLKEYPYMVLAIEARPRRADWFKIPELANAYQDLQNELRSGKHDPAMDALAVFKRTAVTCPDLLPEHARKLAAEVSKEAMETLSFVRTSAGKHALKPMKNVRIFSD